MLRYKYLAVCLSLAFFGCGVNEKQEKGTNEIEKLAVEGIKNVFRLSPRIITGGQPDGEEGFAELQKLGVKTIVSVTDATPDEEKQELYEAVRNYNPEPTTE